MSDVRKELREVRRTLREFRGILREGNRIRGELDDFGGEHYGGHRHNNRRDRGYGYENQNPLTEREVKEYLLNNFPCADIKEMAEDSIGSQGVENRGLRFAARECNARQ